MRYVIPMDTPTPAPVRRSSGTVAVVVLALVVLALVPLLFMALDHYKAAALEREHEELVDSYSCVLRGGTASECES
jgi:hypothetical protein